MGIRFGIYLAVILFGLSYLVLWGKRAGRGAPYPFYPYALALGVSVAAAFWLGRLPNPMAGTTRLYKALVSADASLVPSAAVFLFFLVLAVIGNKLICGWGPCRS